MHKPFFCLIFAIAKAIDHEAPSFGSTIHRGVEQLAARRAHNPEVGGSSPPPATTADDLKKSSAFFVLVSGRCRALFLPRWFVFCSDVRIFGNGGFHALFPWYFWGQKYQKPPHVVFRGSADLWCRHGRQRINKDKYVSVTCALFFTPQGDPRLGSDGGKADGGLKARAAGTVCLQTRAVARRRFQASGRRHRNRSGGFCCFSLP